jgi:DNA invertase Pin-like site-specific DNA recombinase
MENKLKVKYVRYSAEHQKADRQLLKSGEFDKIYMEQVSGCVPMNDRLEGARLMGDIKAGKVRELHINEISRIGRNVIDTMQSLQVCKEHFVNVVVENMGLQSIIDGKPNPVFEIISGVIAVIAQQERECMLERLEQGRIAARNKGTQFGRTRGSVESDKEFYTKPKVIQILKYLEKGEHTIREMALLSESSTFLVQKVLKKEREKQLKMQFDLEVEEQRKRDYELIVEAEMAKSVNRKYNESRTKLV